MTKPKQRHQPINKKKPISRELFLKTEGELYGKITKELGCCNFSVLGDDGKQYICKIRGNMKKIKVREGDFVLVASHEGLTQNSGTIIWKYEDVEVKLLKLPRNMFSKDEEEKPTTDPSSEIDFSNI